MKYRMIAIDLDGTLLSPSGEVTPRTRAAVHRALGAGLIICFATGRNFTESQTVLEAVGHYDLAVFVGGAMVIDTRKRVTLHRTLMHAELAREISRFFESKGLAVLALQDTRTAGVDYLISGNITPGKATQRWLDATRASVQRINDLGEHPHDHTIRIGIDAPAENSELLHDDLQRAFGSRIVSHCINVPAYGVQVMEVFDPAVNKWQGILHVADHHHVSPEQIIAIGDEVNDIPMLAHAGLGVAMGNAHPQLLARAAKVIGNNREDGLSIFLEELLTKQN